MIEVRLEDGRVFDVEYDVVGSDTDWQGRAVPEVEVTEMWDEEGNEVHFELIGDPTRDEIVNACVEDILNNPPCDEG